MKIYTLLINRAKNDRCQKKRIFMDLIGHTLSSNSHHTPANWNLYFHLIICYSRNFITWNRFFLAQERWPNEFRTLNPINQSASYRHYLHVHMHIPTLIIVELWFLDHNIPVLCRISLLLSSIELRAYTNFSLRIGCWSARMLRFVNFSSETIVQFQSNFAQNFCGP